MLAEETKVSPKRYSARMRRFKENLSGYLFVAPAFLIISVFGLFPIGYSIYMSTFQWRVRKGDFIGIENYKKIIGDWTGLLLFLLGIAILILAYILWNKAGKAKTTLITTFKIAAVALIVLFGIIITFGWDKMIAAGDEEFLNSLIITVFYAVGSVPLQLIIALVLAYILFQNIKGKELFRMIFFLPYVTPVVTTAVVFRIIFSPRETSLANILIGKLGIEPLKWLFEPKAISELMFGLKDLSGLLAGPSLALITIILFGVWTFVGYNTVIFLAGLGGISKEVYEAAEIDGANSWDLFRFVTVPLLSPITFYLFLNFFYWNF